MLGFDMSNRDRAFMRLDFHPKDKHTVYFEQGQKDNAATPERPPTRFTAWFEENLQ